MSGRRKRKTTEVAVGVLLRADGAVLLADRPAGKPYAGYWEFPGGKIEAGETVASALARELREELDVAIVESLPWVTFEFDYPHAYVRLHFERVYAWHGTPHAREGQRLTFRRPEDVAPAPLLPAAIPALRWLRLPDALDLETDRPANMATVAASAMRHLQVRPASEWAGAYAETRADIERAAQLQFDFALVGPIREAASVAAIALGWDGFATLVRAPPLPVYAYGAVGPEDLARARRRGAHGIALSAVTS